MNRPPNHLRARRRGLTLAELILGMAMLGIVMMAAAGLIAAVAAGWKSGDAVARTANVAERAGQRVEDALAAALYVLQVKAPATAGANSYVFFWKTDGITGLADGKAQFGEMALIEFDPATKAILLYEPMAGSAMTSAQFATASNSDWGDPTSPDVVTFFKQQTFVQAATTLIGGQSGASEVSAATFTSFATPGAKPLVSYSLTMAQGGLPVARQGTVTLRAGQKPRNI